MGESGKISSSLSIRQMREADIESAMRLKDAEGWNQTEEDWRLFLSHNPELCLVASVEENVIGTVTAINYNNEVAWIGMLLVSQEARRQGVGKLLLHAVMDRLKDCCSIKLDASPAGNPVYTKLGFVEELKLQRMWVRGFRMPAELPDLGTVQRIRETDTQDVIDFDRQVFGTDRNQLIRFLVRDRSVASWVVRRDGQLVGILSVRKGTRYHHIAPVYVRFEEDAKALVAMAVRELAGQDLIVDIHADKSAFKDWLLKLGFASQRPFQRMYYRGNQYAGEVQAQFAISGPELG